MNLIMKSVVVAVFACVISMVSTNTIHAVEAIKVQPLEYRGHLKEGEKQRGYVDVSNPSPQALTASTSVLGFRQVDGRGSLKFYSDEQLKSGIKLDLDEVSLNPYEAIRVYFEIDGSKLPSGDVYGVIFFQTNQKQQGNVSTSIRVGTLLSIVNGTPGARSADITKLSVSPISFNSTATGNYVIRNTANKNLSTGFYPNVNVSVWPFGQTKTVSSSLVFAGLERQNWFELPLPSFGGIYRISVEYKKSVKHAYILSITPVFICFITLAVLTIYRKRHYIIRRRKIHFTKR